VTASSLSLVAPAYMWAPESYTTLGDEVADLAVGIGYAPDPEQRIALDMMYGARKDRIWSAFEFCVICSRQNLKTGVLKMAAIADLFLFDDRLVLWTAHRYDATEGAFRDIKELIDANYSLSRRVKSVTSGMGDMEIILTSGATMQFLARSSGSARSKSASKLFYDEAFALRPGDIGDSVPTLATVAGAQIRYGSSAGKAGSAVLRALRDRGRRGGDKGLAYIEWCDAEAPSCADGSGCTHETTVEGCCLDDRERWRRSNPAMGRRIAEERIEQFRALMPPREFAREFLGWWDEPDGVGTVITTAEWATVADLAVGDDGLAVSRITGALAFAVAVPMDRSHAVLGAAGDRADGLVHLEIVEERRGTLWLPERLKELAAEHGPVAVVIDPGSPAGSLIPDIEALGLTVLKTTVREYAQACQGFVDGVKGVSADGPAVPLFRHLGDSQLDAAIAGATTRPMGDGLIGWGRRGTVDISPLEAVTLAAYGLTVSRDADLAGAVW
jgi:hypothetical protein